MDRCAVGTTEAVPCLLGCADVLFEMLQSLARFSTLGAQRLAEMPGGPDRERYKNLSCRISLPKKKLRAKGAQFDLALTTDPILTCLLQNLDRLAQLFVGL